MFFVSKAAYVKIGKTPVGRTKEDPRAEKTRDVSRQGGVELQKVQKESDYSITSSQEDRLLKLLGSRSSR